VDALVTRKDTTIARSPTSRQARRGDARHRSHIFLVRALQSVGLTEKDISPVLLQHPDGKTR